MNIIQLYMRAKLYLCYFNKNIEMWIYIMTLNNSDLDQKNSRTKSRTFKYANCIISTNNLKNFSDVMIFNTELSFESTGI